MNKKIERISSRLPSVLSRREFLERSAAVCALSSVSIGCQRPGKRAPSGEKTSREPEAIEAALRDSIYTRLLSRR